MYCSSCGAAVAGGLSYCNHCGAKLGGAPAAAESSGPSPDSLVWALVAILIAGLGAVIGLMAVMKETVGFSNEVILAVAVPFLLLMFVAEAVLVGLLLKRVKRGVGKSADDAPQASETKELDAARPASLPEHVPSVTEQTTRAFGPSHAERAAAKR